MLRFILVCLVLVIYSVNACDVLTETHHGCKIENSQCICGFGCKSEFRYTTKKECTDSLKGRANDICGRQPCINGGTCLQTSLSPGYKCKCEGTRHYGNRCQRPCPNSRNFEQFTIIPHECIEI
ncbi:protocadherin-like wing polarity protein stan [Chironomus tepperi]|uniref:protocadherin-like wing polarity protein stan n=1 Tax=Chironomus tepperi TaxID=113505 RepID=UPI00391FAD3E